jgi:hypothetical protein
MAEKFGEADFTIAITGWLLAQVKRDYPNLRPDQALLGPIGTHVSGRPIEMRTIAARRYVSSQLGGYIQAKGMMICYVPWHG